MLNGVHAAGSSSSNSTRGTERQSFIDSFLSEVLPPPFRFGEGDITDVAGNRSGQVDVVVEFPFLPSLPIVGSSTTRLYLAEGVAAAIEVKSDVSTQWNEVLRTAGLLAPLRRNFESSMVMGAPPTPGVPLFAVGYKGWRTPETISQHLAGTNLAGVLVIDHGIFVGHNQFNGIVAGGPWALWGLIGCLHFAASGLKATSANPIRYAV
jgi:hypothetical protein